MSRNRRRHPRVRARGVAAHLRTSRGRTPCVVENISIGGLFVRTDRLEAVGAEIFVDLVRPGWKKVLTMTAKVTSCVDALDGRLSKRTPGMGLQFLRADDKQHERLLQLLHELGAPDTLEVTLPDEATEMELKPLDPREEMEPLDPQPQPLWQQVQMVEEAIEGALKEAHLPPPGPVAVEDRRPPNKRGPSSPPASNDITPPRQSAPAPAPEPQQSAPIPAPSAPVGPDSAKLMLQIRGLILELSDAQQQLSQRDHEIERLREELETTRGALERALRKE